MVFYLVFEGPQGVVGGREASEYESCTNCAGLQEELKLCKAKAAQDLQRLKEDVDEERKTTSKKGKSSRGRYFNSIMSCVKQERLKNSLRQKASKDRADPLIVNLGRVDLAALLRPL